MPDSQPPESLPSVEALQFRRAQPIVTTGAPSPRTCEACKQVIPGDYYQVQSHVICPSCADRIRAGQQTPRSVSLFLPVVYGFGAALAGCILYAIVLAMGVQIGIVALLVGWMVGKAIRHASHGIGGRPQQILAVGLTYFAISTSFLPASLMIGMKRAAEMKKQTQAAPTPPFAPAHISAGQAIAGIVMLATISPFLELKSSPAGGLISLFILFVGLQRAWAMTAKPNILITGPFH